MLEGKLFVEYEPHLNRSQLVEVLKGNDGKGNFHKCLVKLYASDDKPYWTWWSYLSDEITNPMEILAWSAS